MTSAGEAKPAGVAAKPAVTKNGTPKSNGPGSSAKPATSTTPAAKVAAPGHVRKPVGNATQDKPAPASPNLTKIITSPVPAFTHPHDLDASAASPGLATATIAVAAEVKQLAVGAAAPFAGFVAPTSDGAAVVAAKLSSTSALSPTGFQTPPIANLPPSTPAEPIATSSPLATPDGLAAFSPTVGAAADVVGDGERSDPGKTSTITANITVTAASASSCKELAAAATTAAAGMDLLLTSTEHDAVTVCASSAPVPAGTTLALTAVVARQGGGSGGSSASAPASGKLRPASDERLPSSACGLPNTASTTPQASAGLHARPEAQPRAAIASVAPKATAAHTTLMSAVEAASTVACEASQMVESRLEVVAPQSYTVVAPLATEGTEASGGAEAEGGAQGPSATAAKAAVTAAVTASPDISPVTQITQAPESDYIAVKPVTRVPIAKVSSIKVISAPRPLGAWTDDKADKEGANGDDKEKVQPTAPCNTKRRTSSAAWVEPTPAAAVENEAAAALPVVSDPVAVFVAAASSKRLLTVVSDAAFSTPPPPLCPPASPPDSSSSAAVAAAVAAGVSRPVPPLVPGPSGNILHVSLEHNPGGPCPVELSLASLNPGGSGGVLMTADVVTAAMKALRAKYGAVQAGPAVNAFFLEPGSGAVAAAGGRRRWLPPFDPVPPELLALAVAAVPSGDGCNGGVHILLQGLVCEAAADAPTLTSSAKSSEVPRIPVITLPGFTELGEMAGHSLGAPAATRVAFLSETGSGRASTGSASTLAVPKSLLRGASRKGSLCGVSGAGGGANVAGGGGRILGAGHRSVRIRLEEKQDEMLCVESAGPSATSMQSEVRGGSRLPPLRCDSTASTEPTSGGGGGDGPGGGPNPLRGRLAITRSSRRLIVAPVDNMAEDSVGSSEFDHAVRDPVQILKSTEGVGADPDSRLPTAGAVAAGRNDADGGECGGGHVVAQSSCYAGGEGSARDSSVMAATSAVTAAPGKGRAAYTGSDGATLLAVAAGGSTQPGVVKKAADVDPASGEDVEAAFFPAPAAEWSELMGPGSHDDGGVDSEAATASTGCLSCFSAGNKVTQHHQWKERLREAITSHDEKQLAAWISFHSSRSGSRDVRELNVVLWLAVEARAPELVRLLLQRGAYPDAPRPTGPFNVVASTTGSPKGLGGVNAQSADRPMSPSRVKDFNVAAGVQPGVQAAAAPPQPPGSWWPGSAAAASSSAALQGLTPLMRAAELASYSVVEVLLSSGADPLVSQPAHGWTALHHAVLATPPSPSASWACRRVSPASPSSPSGGSSGSSASNPVSGSAGKSDDPASAALQCLRLLVQRIGPQRVGSLVTCGRHIDDVLRFCVRYGRSAALSFLMSGELVVEGAVRVDEYDDEDESSCAFLAGRLGLTVEVWDTPPPPPPLRQSAAATVTASSVGGAAAGSVGGRFVSHRVRDPARPLLWLISAEERQFADRRRQLIMGAAVGGRVEVLAAVLDKLPPFDHLRRDELDAALGACRLSPPRNQRQVEELLLRRAHCYMVWDRDVLPALRRVDIGMIDEWLLRDRPMPVEVDRALVVVLSSERLGSPIWYDNVTASVQALLDAGADIEYEWELDPAAISPREVAEAILDRGVKTLRPLHAALMSPAPAVVRQLLAAGADARRRDSFGENALFFAIRIAATAAVIAREFENTDAVVRMVQHEPGSVSRVERAGVIGAAASECIEVLLDTECASELLAARNDQGLTPAVLAALADLKSVVVQLAAAGADPWCTPLPASLGAPNVPKALLPTAAVSGGPGKRSAAMAAPAGLWSVGHEVARLGALSVLPVLLGDPSSSSSERKGHLMAATVEQAAARRRDALIGAIRGGHLTAAKLALDADGLGGSLYESELAAALELCKTSSTAPPLPPPPGTADIIRTNSGAHEPPRYDALSAFLASRAHVYMSWEVEVLPALRTANVSIVRRWISCDIISSSDATRALCALVDSAQQCNTSGSAAELDPSAAAAATAVAQAAAVSVSRKPSGDACEGVLSVLSSAAASQLVAPGRAAAEVAAHLVRAGADVNWPLDGALGGLTPLMQATLKGHLPLVEMLLSQGARVDAEDAAGLTAVDHAVLSRARLGNSGCLAALLPSYGARRLNAHRTHAGDSALMLAVRSADSTAAQLLLSAGATPAAADAGTPIAVATAVPVVAAAASTSLSSSSLNVVDPPSSAAGSRGGGDASSRDFAPSHTVGRRGSALYLAARMDDKPMVQQLLRQASVTAAGRPVEGDGGAGGGGGGDIEVCRQEVQLGALHGGRLGLLEASMALPELLKTVAGPVEGVGRESLGGAAAVCARLSEQANMRLAEAQAFVRELEVVAEGTAAASSDPALGSCPSLPSDTLNPADVPRLRRYLVSKVAVLEAVRGCHSRIGEFYSLAKMHLEALEGGLEAKKEQVSCSLLDLNDAHVQLLSATTRLTASRETVLRSALARRDAQLQRVEGLLEKRLGGLTGALRRAEQKVTSEVEGLILDMRKLVGRRLQEIEAKKVEGLGRLGALERKLEQVWSRKQRLLTGRPPAVRAAMNQRMSAVTQQLALRREALLDAVAAAVSKMEGGQRRCGALVNLEAMRGVLGRSHQDMTRAGCDTANIAKAAVVNRAEELLRNDKHDQLLRIVGQMTVEVNRESAAASAAAARTLAALQQTYAMAAADLERRVSLARSRMQDHLTELVSKHSEVTRALIDTKDDTARAGSRVEAGQDADASSGHNPPPDVAMLLLDFEGAAALDLVEGLPPRVEAGGRGVGGTAGIRDGPSWGCVESSVEDGGAGVLRRVNAVEEMIEDVIEDMNTQVLRAFPADSICDTLSQSDLAPLMEPDEDISTATLGLDKLRQDIAAIDFGLPNLDLEIGDLDLSALDDDEVGGAGLHTFGGGGLYDTYDNDDDVGARMSGGNVAAVKGRYGSVDGGGAGGGIARQRQVAHGRGRASCSTDDDGDVVSHGRYTAAEYGAPPEEDFALSYS